MMYVVETDPGVWHIELRRLAIVFRFVHVPTTDGREVGLAPL